MDERENRSGSVIGTAMSVLRCFGHDKPDLGVVEISERTGIHKSTISRLMGTLESENLVERDPASRKYRLGLGLLSVAGALLADLDVRRAAFPVLRELAEQTGESCSLMVWAGGQSICVEQIPSSQPIKHTTAIGTTYRTTASSSVKVFLAELSPEELRQMVRRGGPVARDGHADLADLEADLAQIRDRGVAVNDGATDPAEVGLSAVVRDHRDAPVAAVLISAPRFRIDQDRLAELTEACREAAGQVTRSLGASASS